MEYLDIVDENNEFTGIVEQRKKAHEKNLWHRYQKLSILVLNNQKK